MGGFGWFMAGAGLILGGFLIMRYARSRDIALTAKNIAMACISYSLLVLTVNVTYLCFWEGQMEAGIKLGLILGGMTLISLYALYRTLRPIQDL